MEDPGGGQSWIVPLIALFVLGFLISLCEYAFSLSSQGKLKKQAEEGNKKAERVLRLLRPSVHLNMSLQTWGMLCWLFAGAFTLWGFQGRLAKVFPPEFAAASLLSGVILLVALAFLLLALVRLTPKRIAAREPQKLAMALAPAAGVLCGLATPLRLLLSGVSSLLARLFGFTARDPNAGVTEEEILLMVDAGQEKGVLEESQKEMISNIFEFEDLTAGDIMTHRTDILGIEVGASLQEAVRIALLEGYSRIPVYEENIDSIIGILYSKDLLRLVGRESKGDFRIRSYMRPALYVPESNRCSELFKTFTTTKTQMAVVVDEYGGTSGLVTMEDLLEEIVGNIQDEYDNDEVEIVPIGENTYVIDGLTGLDDVGDLLHLSFEEEDESESDTLGGFIINRIGRIPSRGDRVVITHQGFRFTVLSVKDRRILKVRAEKLPEGSLSQA